MFSLPFEKLLDALRCFDPQHLYLWIHPELIKKHKDHIESLVDNLLEVRTKRVLKKAIPGVERYLYVGTEDPSRIISMLTPDGFTDIASMAVIYFYPEKSSHIHYQKNQLIALKESLEKIDSCFSGNIICALIK